VTPHPDVQAREFLSPYFDMLDALGPAKMNRDIHSAKLAALLVCVRTETFKYVADNLYEGMYSAEIKELEKKFDGQ